MTTVIIEISGGNLYSVYSDSDISFFLIDRDNQAAGGPNITGPFSPTLVKEDLSRAIPDTPDISQELLKAAPLCPYF
jgi:hypothetical protein